MKRRLLVFASMLLAVVLLVGCKKTYEVKFDLDGGQLPGIVETVKVKEKDKVDNPGAPTKADHDFKGWYVGSAEYDFAAEVTANLTIKAKWEKQGDVEPPVDPKSFVVGFDLNVDGAGNIKPQVVEEGKKAVKPADPQAEYKVFLGWYLDDVAYDFNAEVKDNLVLVAKWESLKVHNIVYEGVEDNNFAYAVKNEMMEAFFADFYAYINPDGITLAQFVHAVPGDFNGFWKNYANDKKLYSGDISNLNKLDGKTFATHEVYGPKWYSLFDFMDGWIKGINSAQYFWAAGGSSVSTGVTRLQQYAANTKPATSVRDEYMIAMPKGEVVYKPVSVYVEGEGADLPVPYKALYAFEGWYANSDFVGEPIVSLDEDAKGAKTLHAKWRKLEVYNVITSLNYDGAKTIEPEVLYETDLATRPASPTREDHIFDGWTSDVEGKVPYDFTAPVMGDLVIYAKWLEAVFVTYDYDTEDVKDVVVKMVKDTEPAKPADPTKKGFKFDGWYDDDKKFDFTEKLAADVELVAKWVELDVYTIEYDFNDGEMMPKFENRDAMVVAFLTDYYNFISGYPGVYDTSKPENTLEKFIGDTGKPNDISVPTAPKYKYDGNFNTAMSLLTQQNMSVDLTSRYFVAQLEYNKWRPLVENMETYSHVGNPDQHIWGVAEFRVKPFIGMLDLWRYHDAPTTKIIKDAMELIPQQYLDPIEEYDEQSAFALPFPIMDSAEFLGWYDNKELTGEPIFKIEAGTEGDLKLYAKWNKLDVVKATYHYYGGSFDTVIVFKDSILDEPVYPVRPLHRFDGWYDNENYTGEPFDFDTDITANIDLYAKWTKLETVVVKFDAANGSDEVEVELVKDALIAKPETPVKDGYEFVGWYDGTAAFDFEAGVAKDVTLVAKWNEILSVVHHYNGGGLGSANMIDLLQSVHVVAPRYGAADPTGESYSVSTGKSVWWYALAFKETGVAGVYELVGKQGANVAADFDTSEVVFYVQYHDGLKGNFVAQIKQIYTDIKVGDLLVIPNEPEEMASHNNSNVDLYYFYEFKLDDQYPIRFDFFEDLVTPVKEGFMFDGWYAEEALTTKVESLPASITANLNLYAKWVEIPEYTVTLDQNYKDDEDEPVVSTVKQYKDLALPVPATPKRAGYLFTYWHLDGAIYDFNTPMSKDLTLVAGWYKLLTFDVTFEVDGEEYAVVPTEEYAAVKLPASPTKTGNIFAGWLLDGEPYDPAAPVEGDLKLVASWLGSVKVLHELYDGIEFTLEVVKGGKIEKPLQPERFEYIFLGWYLDDEEFNFDNPITENVIIKAHWQEAPFHQINYYLDGGELPSFEDRDEMLLEFFTDYYNWQVANELLSAELSLTDYIHGEGKTSGYDGSYTVANLYNANDREIDHKKDKFINQPEYNEKWLPLLDLIHDYVQMNPEQSFWGSTYIGGLRFMPFMKKSNLWGASNADTVAKIVNTVPEKYNVIKEYSIFSEVATFKTPMKARHEFLGWYDNAEFTGNPVTKLNPELDSDITLYAKWSAPYYSVDYQLDGGEFALNTREKMLDAFLTDLYAFVKPTESLEVFMHGEGNTEGYEGTWHSDADHKAKIYAGPRPEAVDNNYFISHEDYMDKWLPFFDTVEAFIRKVNPDQFFYGAGTSVGLIRIGQYVKNVKPAAWVPQSYLDMMPEEYIPIESYNVDSTVVDLVVPVKDGFVFLGWYDNAEFSGDAITKVDVSKTADLVLYAKWEAK